MPLPPTLAARLAKRGIVNDSRGSSEKKQRTEAEEEVIAENYDSNYKSSGDTGNFGAQNSTHDDIPSSGADKHFKGHSGCPNKWNIYHECSSFCVKRWGKGITNPDPRYLRKQARLLSKFPLPNNWKDIYDPGTGRHYYWDMQSDMVSWLPPNHPKSNVSESAATIKEERHMLATDADGSDHESESADEDDEEATAPRPPEKEKERDRDLIKEKNKFRTKNKANDLDPMDPAAYSEAPRGKWSDGLERGNEAKTGADVTASGPLYQMRPYPNPGAVLRANAATGRPAQN
ncbi:polyglutamine-binding protein 1 [Cimex lectularius]|uniref:Polyglutamine-binding protein 1 n=1 Tax=Cimex lectularius TaxID=79782 RepID=A0A8I6R9F0_CIMLE|nr:polyglutamine-binding protein 1 [Cimex lectularius]XP_014241017.1 polyglutamine-binding protein 1 [Cimex lectularius]XP_014241018.1 polyglutamine-binding protein 1 [Cimex lectularius]